MLSSSTSHVFVHQDPESPPPPDPSSTRFVCVSDTHSRTFAIPPGDVLLHAGDLTSWGKVSEMKKTIDWLASLPHPVKIIIAGNHDLCLDQSWTGIYTDISMKAAQDVVRGPSARNAGIYYLEHESVEFTTSQGHRWKVYGSPAAPRYAEGAFQYFPGAEAREIYGRIPEDTDILLTHTPPYQVHDLTKKGKHAGCKDLADRIQQLEEAAAISSIPSIAGSEETTGALDALSESDSEDQCAHVMSWNCRLHVWGHIHEAYGASIKTSVNGDCVHVNAALAWHGEPIIVDLVKATQRK